MERTRQFRLLQPSLAPHRSLCGALTHFCANTFSPKSQSAWITHLIHHLCQFEEFRCQRMFSFSPSLFLSDGLKQTLLFFLLYYNSIFHNVHVTAVAFKQLMSLRIRSPWAQKQYSVSEGVWGEEGWRDGSEWEKLFCFDSNLMVKHMNSVNVVNKEQKAASGLPLVPKTLWLAYYC